MEKTRPEHDLELRCKVIGLEKANGYRKKGHSADGTWGELRRRVQRGNS
jgi:hypothetical protein